MRHGWRLRWFVLLPDGVPEGRLWEVINQAAADAPPHPSALPLPTGTALRRLYDA